MTSPPNILYHYCPIPAFEGIVKTRHLWLTSSFHTNDSLENHAIGGRIARVLEGYKSTSHLERFCALLSSALSDQTTIPFVACFSADGDKLSQWRGYAGDATGVAIGFGYEYFRDAIPYRLPPYFDHTRALISLHEVIYDPAEQQDRVEEIIAKYVGQVRAGDPASANNAAGNCRAELTSLSYVCKHHAFEEEQEWRIVHNPHAVSIDGKNSFLNPIGDLFFNTRRDDLVPYFQLDFSQTKPKVEPIVEVVVGSKAKVQQWALKTFLEVNGIHHVGLKRSEVPYR